MSPKDNHGGDPYLRHRKGGNESLMEPKPLKLRKASMQEREPTTLGTKNKTPRSGDSSVSHGCHGREWHQMAVGDWRAFGAPRGTGNATPKRWRVTAIHLENGGTRKNLEQEGQPGRSNDRA